jgi:hypothetical protein
MCTASVRKKRVFAKKIVHPDCVLKIFAHTQHLLKKNQNCLIFFNPCKITQKIKKCFRSLQMSVHKNKIFFEKIPEIKTNLNFFILALMSHTY